MVWGGGGGGGGSWGGLMWYGIGAKICILLV